MKQQQQVKTGFAFVTPFSNYIVMKDQFQKDHPTAKILEEMKTLSLAEIEVPNTTNIQMIGQKVKQQVVMIAYGCVYTELVDADKVNSLQLKDENL